MGKEETAHVESPQARLPDWTTGQELLVEAMWVINDLGVKSCQDNTHQTTPSLVPRKVSSQKAQLQFLGCQPSHTLLSLVLLSLVGPWVLFFFLLVFCCEEGRDSSNSLLLASQSSSRWSSCSPFCLVAWRWSQHWGSALGEGNQLQPPTPVDWTACPACRGASPLPSACGLGTSAVQSRRKAAKFKHFQVYA